MIERELDPPLEALLRPRDAQVAESALLAKHRQGFILVALGPDEVWMRVDVLGEPGKVGGQAQEVIRFALRFGGPDSISDKCDFRQPIWAARAS